MKKNKTISIDDEIFNKLSIEENASGLIESLLYKHYDFLVLHDAKTDVTDLEAKAKELHLKLEEIDVKKKEVLSSGEKKDKLTQLGITNTFLVERLKKLKEKDFRTLAFLKKEYNLPEVLALYNAWDILHDEEKEEELS